MRIIRGKLKGKKLNVPLDQSVRPTLDRHRETIFNIIEHASWAKNLQSIKGQWEILDLFCGTGALGLEAFSRGGKHVCFVDKSLKLCHQNISKCALNKDDATFIQSDILQLTLDISKFDVIFMDPPYGMNLVPKTLALLHPYLSEETVLVVEHEATLKDECEGFEEMRIVETKKSTIRFLKKSLQKSS